MLEMPMPPALANDLAYWSAMNERHIFKAPLPPNGPSPSMPVNISWNMLLKNMDSKFWADSFALPFTLSAAAACEVAPAPSDESETLRSTGLRAAITSPGYRPEWRRQPCSLAE